MEPTATGGPQLPELSPQKLTILTIDDAELVLEVFARRLAQHGQEVLTALSGRKAIEVFQSRSVDVILCDLDMPDMDGWEVGRSIKDVCVSNTTAKPPFILVTGAPPDRITEGMMQECGVDAVISKPVDAKGLLEVINRVLGKHVTLG
jgi:CheY-like chemotaxis protein